MINFFPQFQSNMTLFNDDDDHHHHLPFDKLNIFIIIHVDDDDSLF